MKDGVLVFGGTFDPVHVGHLIVSRAAMEQVGADRVVLMPSATPPHKAGPVASATDRLAMLREAVGDDEVFEISTMELDRGGPSYTYLTLRELRASLGSSCPVSWLIGLDMLRELDAWRNAEEVVESCRIVTAVRSPLPDDLDCLMARLAGMFGSQRARSLREDLLSTPTIDISSTEIRNRSQRGRSIRYFVPDRVAHYIERNGLYA